MVRQCQCGGAISDADKYCVRCGCPISQAAIPQQSGGSRSSGMDAWKLGVVLGVLVLGVVFGSLVAVMSVGRASSGAASETAANSSPVRSSGASSAFQQAFDGSGTVSQAAADSYCDCALSALKQKASPMTIVATCKQRLMR
jgi:hypothetical protein